MIWTVLAGSCVLSVVYGGWAVLQPAGTMRTWIKTGATLLLMLAAILAGGPWALTAALVASAVGDFFLARDGESQRLAGIGAFAAAHLFLVLLFLSHGSDLGAVLSIPAAILVVFAGAYAALLARNAGPLARPVVGYVAIILTMALVAMGLPEVYAMATLGAVLFVMSDALIGVDFFLLPAGARARRWIAPPIWFSYWGAQVLFLYAFALGDPG